MNSKKVIGLIALIIVFVVACAGTTEKLSEQDLILNPNEPWTGIWKTKRNLGSSTQDIVVMLKQEGNVVKSAKGCFYGFTDGKISGDQLKASYIGGWNTVQRLTFIISDDLKSFEGEELFDPHYTFKLNGARQKEE